MTAIVTHLEIKVSRKINIYNCHSNKEFIVIMKASESVDDRKGNGHDGVNVSSINISTTRKQSEIKKTPTITLDRSKAKRGIYQYLAILIWLGISMTKRT